MGRPAGSLSLPARPRRAERAALVPRWVMVRHLEGPLELKADRWAMVPHRDGRQDLKIAQAADLRLVPKDVAVVAALVAEETTSFAVSGSCLHTPRSRHDKIS